MVSDIFKAGASSVAADLRRHLSPVALDALIESLRAEEPSGALATSTLYLLEELDPGISQDHQAQCLEFGYKLVA